MSILIEKRPFTSQCIDARDLLDLTPKLVKGIRKTPHGTFGSLGVASLGGLDIWVGLKTRLSGHSAAGRWAREAILADQVMEKFPDTIHAFPLFTLPVIADSDEGRRRGLLTEDFTQGAQIPLDEYHQPYPLHSLQRWQIQSDLERKVYDSAGGSVYPEAFRHMAGRVSLREVMVDYDDIFFPTMEEIAAYEEIGRVLTIDIPKS